MTEADLLLRLQDRWSAIESEIFDVHNFIHQHIEISGSEFQCNAKLVEALRANGIKTETPFYGLETAFMGQFGAEQPEATIAFLCEYDGLPPYGQSCGHNVVSASSLGAALLLKDIAAEFGLQIQVIGTPAEEGFGGKRVLADAGAFNDVDAALLIYPGMDDIADSRTLYAQGFEAVMQGQAAHAAAHPELGRNALDAMMAAFVAAASLRPSADPQARFHGIITEGGIHPQVVPERAVAKFAVRGSSLESVEQLSERVTKLFTGVADAHLVALTLEKTAEPALGLKDNQSLVSAVAGAMNTVGRKVLPRDELSGAWSTDAGYLSRFVPVAQPQFSMTDRNVSPHSLQFHDASTGVRAEQTIKDAALTLALTALRIASDSKLNKQIKSEFKS